MRMKKRILGIDFDGVILEPLLNIRWSSPDHFSVPKKSSALQPIIEACTILMRRQKPGIADFIKQSAAFFEEMHLITARPDGIKDITHQWLAQQHIAAYFTSLNHLTPALSPFEHKKNLLLSLGCTDYIDDDEILITALAKELPHITFYLLSPTTSKTVISSKNVQVGSLDELQNFHLNFN